MKNIWNDPRSLFNGNHFSSLLTVGAVSSNPTYRMLSLSLMKKLQKFLLFWSAKNYFSVWMEPEIVTETPSILSFADIYLCRSTY